jgi:hypothetical protein
MTVQAVILVLANSLRPYISCETLLVMFLHDLIVSSHSNLSHKRTCQYRQEVPNIQRHNGQHPRRPQISGSFLHEHNASMTYSR